jgi:hypothetical protein
MTGYGILRLKKYKTAQEKTEGIQRAETKVVLNAQKVMGDKAILSRLQDNFYDQVSKQFGLERGRPAAETKRAHSAHTLKFAAQELRAKKEKLDARFAAVEKSFRVLEAATAKAGNWKCPPVKQGESMQSYYARIEQEVLGAAYDF